MRAWMLSLLSPLALSCAGGDKPATDTASLDNSSVDEDRDGFSGAEDCNEADGSVHAGATELCDGIDNNCDGTVDEGVTQRWYADLDQDGFGDPGALTEACAPPEEAVANGTDCDDARDDVYPGADDLCDSVDNDCDGEIDEDESVWWYADADGDTWGDAALAVLACEAPPGHVEVDGDCDDANAEAFPGHVEVCDELDNDCDGETDEGVRSLFFEDRDADGWGQLDSTTEACAAPVGYAPDGGDCDDADDRYHPGATEDDCTDPNDYNCDGSVGYVDADLDNWAACVDCDDSDAAVNPDMDEICNEVDDDCNTWIDDEDPGLDLSSGELFYADDDSDSFGDPGAPIEACEAPTDYVADATDCDDADSHINPAATEVCNGDDDDCDSLIDDDDSGLDLSSADPWYTDADADGYGALATVVLACDAPTGTVADASDCDDTATAVHPGATEICDEIDNDCDAAIDDADSGLDRSTGGLWYADSDGDTYGASAASTRACDAPAGYVARATDCNDSAAAINPAATEVCDSVDNDCDSAIDDADSSVDWSTGTVYYRDADGDTYGLSATTLTRCSLPSGYASRGADCDDAAVAINPAATEVCDSKDNDCDALIDDADSSLSSASTSTWYRDVDGDGYGSTTSTRACLAPSGYKAAGSDCDDAAASIYPGATETCNLKDDDCDSATDEGLSDVDADGVCDALDTETCDGRDNDGDGASDEGISCQYQLVRSDSAGLCVDDDVYANLNGSRIYTDTTWGAQCGHTISFTGTPGDTLAIWAVDSVGGCRNIDDIYIIQVASGKKKYLAAGYGNTCGHGASSSAFWSVSVAVPSTF
jgi:hypothetical protein